MSKATLTRNESVISLLSEATKHADTMSAKAREAAEQAAKAAEVAGIPAAERYAAILKTYNPDLESKPVKDVFSAALSVLLSNQPVRIISSAVITTAPSKGAPKGRISFKGAEIIGADEGAIAPEGKTLTELPPNEAVAKLANEVLKKAAKAARESMGIESRSRGQGGRPKNEPVEAKRAPFWEELAAVWKDTALREKLVAFIESQGYKLVKEAKKGAAK